MTNLHYNIVGHSSSRKVMFSPQVYKQTKMIFLNKEQEELIKRNLLQENIEMKSQHSIKMKSI